LNYLPIRDCDLSGGLFVTGAGSCSAGPKSPYPTRRHRGEGVFESAPTGVKQIPKGSVILTFPGVWHRYHPSRDTGWDEFWFGMNGEHLHRLVGQRLLAPSRAILEVDDGAEIEGQCEALMDRVRIEPQRGHSIAACALQALATAREVAVAPPPTPAPAFTRRTAEDAVVAKALQYIWNNSQRPVNVADVVAQFPVTRRSLERRFRDSLGATILEEIMNCRLQRDKQLLSETTLPVGQVSAMSGFARTQRMNDAFQRHEHQSPWAYRRQSQRSEL
jgi:AraC-like DNA-binding protein